jgi:hypothetical protein
MIQKREKQAIRVAILASVRLQWTQLGTGRADLVPPDQDVPARKLVQP